ncbi:50S ribosomal protein L3 [bacterium BMS3Abin07]|nr:50S ribosomal protein L3 [bacterium BMS3Abin07]GBE33387.1 50S ribosomal protein L3 [bacterium BMS3Bbin05]HDL20431.1 50S ribosomal protein L3 [Nitrospirota bacterium]HDO21938.1 50S ribosomal protein L3 [Nitrospirota bacterium]HDZ87736.1 50S ribosomal protein L3 [Nitrospirota bacterium]
MTAILGKKLGMTQIFDEKGDMIPVTVVEAGPCCVIQIKTMERDGYESLKIGYLEENKAGRVNRPMKGVFEKAGVKPYRVIREIPATEAKVGEMVTVEIFQKGDRLNVRGISKGKGFQGVMKRHNSSGGPGSHGSMFNRAPGSIGQSSSPSRVWKNLKLPGHMGMEKVTVKNLTVVDIKPEQNIMIVKGAVPGPNGGYLEIMKGK